MITLFVVEAKYKKTKLGRGQRQTSKMHHESTLEVE